MTFVEKMLRPWITIGGLLIVILGVGYLFKSCQKPDNGDKLPPATKKTIDSLNNTAPEFQKKSDSVIQIIVHDTVESVRFQIAARQAQGEADKVRRVADSLATSAVTANDSAAAWHKAYDARTAETVQLRITIQNDSSALGREIAARQNLANLYGADTTRRIAIEKLNKDLQSAIDKLEKPCKILGPIPCLSRTTTAVLSGSLGALAGHAVK